MALFVKLSDINLPSNMKITEFINEKKRKPLWIAMDAPYACPRF